MNGLSYPLIIEVLTLKWKRLHMFIYYLFNFWNVYLIGLSALVNSTRPNLDFKIISNLNQIKLHIIIYLIIWYRQNTYNIWPYLEIYDCTHPQIYIRKAKAVENWKSYHSIYHVYSTFPPDDSFLMCFRLDLDVMLRLL